MTHNHELNENTVETLLGQVAGQYSEQIANGESPNIDEYADRHPEIADLIQEVFPALDVLRDAAASELSEPGHSGESCLGDFRIVREIGRGGMGIVYEAIQVSLGRPVALKVLPFAGVLDNRRLQRFKNEAHAAAMLDHPNIVPIHSVGCDRGVHYYAMQLISGQSVAEVIEELRELNQSHASPQQPASDISRQLAGSALGRKADPAGDCTDEAPASSVTGDAEQRDVPSDAADTRVAPQAAISTERSVRDLTFFRSVASLAIQAAEGLEHAHSQAVIHRDIKPANLMLDNQGKLWIADFGLATFETETHVTMTGALVGTLRYMSPEQALGSSGDVDRRADIYSLGVTLYELLTLQPAFDGADRAAILKQITLDEPTRLRKINPAIPHELEIIVLTAIAKDPADRYSRAQDLADDLRYWCENKPIRAKRSSPLERLAKWSRRNRPLVWSIAAALSIVILGFAVSFVWVVQAWRSETAQRQLLERSYEETESEAERAKQNLALALDSLEEMFWDGAETHVSRTPETEPWRRELQTNALQFYLAFIAKNRQDPRSSHLVADAYHRLGDLQLTFGRYDDAERAFTTAITLQRALVSDAPQDLAKREELANSHYCLACCYDAQERFEQAAITNREAVQTLAALYQDAPTNTGYVWSLIKSRVLEGQISLQQGQHEEARQAFSHATGLLHVSTYSDPSFYWANPLPYQGDVPTVLDFGVTNRGPTNAEVKERPSQVEIFDQSSGQAAYFWVRLGGISSGDAIDFKYYYPDGRLYDTLSWDAPQIRYGWWNGVTTLPEAPDLGTWSVAFELNGFEVARDTFQVTVDGAPEIRVYQDEDFVIDGRTTPIDFGIAIAGSAQPEKTFTVENHGSAQLDLNSLQVPTGFTLVEGLAGSLAPGQSDTFTVRLDAQSDGLVAGSLRIVNNDADEAQFDFNLSGRIVGAVSPEPGWLVGAGSTGNEQARKVAIDSAGNTYVTGWFGGTVDFADGPTVTNLTSNGGDDGFVAKYGPSGELIWARAFGSSGVDRGRGIGVFADDVYVTGQFGGTVDFDRTVARADLADVHTSSGTEDIFVLKLTADGDFAWAQRMGSSDDPDGDRGRAIVANAGGVYVTGEFKGTVAEFGRDVVENRNRTTGVRDIFVTQLRPSTGDVQWVQTYGSTGSDSALELELDATGDLYVAGRFSSTADFGSTLANPGVPLMLNSGGGFDSFLLKLEPTQGRSRWVARVGGPGDEHSHGLEIDSQGNVYHAGYFSSSQLAVEPGAQLSNSHQSRDVYLTKRSSNGEVIWAHSFGGVETQWPYAVAAASDDEIVLVGRFAGEVDFDPDPASDSTLTSRGADDVYISRFDGAGHFLNVRSAGGTGTDRPFDVAVDFAGNLLVAGQYEGPALFPVGTLDGPTGGASDLFLMKLAAQPTVTLSQNQKTIPEASGSATVTATLETPVEVPVTVELQLGGTATAADFALSATQIVIPAGSQTGSLSVSALDDALAEADETVLVDIAGVANALELGEQQAVITIRSDDNVDLGDLPSPYPTLLSDNGPAHIAVGPRLGAARDTESDGQPDSAADGDGSAGSPADEDGVSFGPPTRAGQLSAQVIVEASEAGRLDAWVDFDGDGSFGNNGERIFTGRAVQAGTNALTFTVPVESRQGSTFSRFRLSTAGGLATTGGAEDGEVEDHVVSIESPPGSGLFASTGQALGEFSYSLNASLGDLDGDGDLDAFVANSYLNVNRIWLNDGTGLFADSGQQLGNHSSTDVALGDLDGDGDLDAFVANRLEGNRVWTNDGGVFSDSGQSLADHASLAVSLGDLDGDGDLDAFVANENYHADRVWLNDGNGRFTDTSQSLGTNFSADVALGDLDGDGDLDAYVATYTTDPNGVWLNDGSARFHDSGHTLGQVDAYGVALGDLDGDGDLDVFIANYSYGNGVYLNDGSGNLSDSGQSLGNHDSVAVALGDLDGDGDLDAFVTNNYGTANRIWQNNGSGQFTDSGQGLGDHESYSVSLGDIDGDGDLDAFVANYEEANRVWRNENLTPAIPLVTLSVDSVTLAEVSGVATFSAELSAPTTRPVTVDLAVSGTATATSDYTVTATRIDIPAGETTGSISVATVDDSLVEPSESIIVDIVGVANGIENGTQRQTTTIIDDDFVPGLVVTSIVPTPSGFSAEFNSELNVDGLNLYDTEAGGFGPADLRLVGASSGAVTGSLVIDSSGRQITFIKSGAILNPDTYTLVLRSAANGFKDVTGVLLDGNGDGNPGDDFSDTFIVGASMAEIGVDDFVRGPAQELNLPANSGDGIPITISDGAAIRNVSFGIDYDPGLLDITGVTPGVAMPAGSTATVDISAPGRAVVTLTSLTDLLAGPNQLVNLQAQVPAANATGIYGDQHVLDIHSIVLTNAAGDELPAVDNDGLHLAAFFGDVSGNGAINATDASQVARVAASLDIGFAKFLLTDPKTVGDISGNEAINATDASMVARHAVELPVDQIPPIPGGVVRAARGQADAKQGLVRTPFTLFRSPWTTPDRLKAPPAVTAWGFEAPVVVSHAAIDSVITGRKDPWVTHDDELPLALEDAVEQLLSTSLLRASD